MMNKQTWRLEAPGLFIHHLVPKDSPFQAIYKHDTLCYTSDKNSRTVRNVRRTNVNSQRWD